LYASKQKNGEDIMTYSMRVETLQNLIIEQDTADFSPKVAQAMETSIKRQVIQVFMEPKGLY